jgi:hypothetical protein
MITVQLVAEAIARLRGDRNAYRIASHLNYLGYPVDMNAIRDILGETHPDLTVEAKPVYEPGMRKHSRNHQKKDEGGYGKRAPRRKGGAA